MRCTLNPKRTSETFSQYLYPMKRLILLEHAAHFEVARSYALLFAAAGWEVVLAVNEQNAGFLRPVFEGKKEISFHVLIKGGQEADYWSALDDLIKNSNLVIVCSHEKRSGGLWHKSGNTPWYLVIHDGYNYLNPLRHLAWGGGPIQWLRIGKYLATGYFSKRKKSAVQYDGWITPVPWPQEWQAQSGVNKVVYLPFLWNESQSRPASEGFQIVIPGTVNLRSRDYQMVTWVLELLASRDLKSGLKVTLLGKINGKSERHLLYTMQKICGAAIELTYYTKAIDSQTFDHIMEEADLLWLPLHRQWQYGVVLEEGGISCLSGNIGDWVRFGKKALVPAHYPSPEILEEKRWTYKDGQEAADLIVALFEKKNQHKEEYTQDKIFADFNAQQIARVNALL